MNPGDERRRELGAFLRKRREEVAYHAGVSVTWYTWLEQGRDINPSRQVLDSIAHNMRLSVAEHEYLLALAGYAPNPPGDLAPTAVAPPHIQRLLDSQAESPAFAVSPDWGIAGWNRAYEALYPNVATVEPGDRNLLFIIFTDPYVRRMLPDWEVTSRHFLAEYRAEAGPSLGHPSHSALVTRLLNASPEFAQAWNEHQIKRFSSRERTFHHPDVGDLTFEHHRLIPSDLPDVHVVVYIPLDTGTREKLQQLIRTLAR